MTRVGWIGLGAMGSPMALCLTRAGFDVTAYDLDPARAAALAGVTPARSIGAAAGGVDALVLMVATPDQVDSVRFGDGAAAAALAPETTVVVMATVGPAAVRRWAERLARVPTSSSPAQQRIFVDTLLRYEAAVLER